MTRLSILTIVVLALSCTADAGLLDPVTGAGEVIRTDESHYAATQLADYPAVFRGFTIVATLRNTTTATLYLERCHPDDTQPIFDVQLLSGDDPRGSAWSPAWGCPASNNPFVVAPGAVRVDTLQLVGPTMIVTDTGEPLGQMEGTFRLGYVGEACTAAGACRTVRFAAVSTPFTVVLE